MNWHAVGDAIGARVANMSEPETFRFYASLYGGLPYMGGKENFIYGADCSGCVCGPLYLMGYDIRCTADDLYHKIFTEEVVDHEARDEIQAAFYITREPTRHFDQMVPAGHVTHVAPVIGRYVLQNAFDPIQPMAAAYVYQWYDRNGKNCEWRQLNPDLLQKHHVDRDLIYGLDPVLEGLR